MEKLAVVVLGLVLAASTLMAGPIGLVCVGVSAANFALGLGILA